MGRRKFHFWKSSLCFQRNPYSLHSLTLFMCCQWVGMAWAWLFLPHYTCCMFASLVGCVFSVCLVSHCLPHWILYSFTSESVACFISVLLLPSACFAQLNLASWLYKGGPFFVILTSSALMVCWRHCRGQVKIIKTLNKVLLTARRKFKSQKQSLQG